MQPKYLQPYRQSHEEHGNNFEVTLWANQQTQKRRFDVFTQMCFFTGKRVLDAGCSRGDFAAYLQEQEILYERFVGIDALAEVVTFAKERRLAETEFHHGDFLADPGLFISYRPQIITLSGTLNTMTDEEVTQTLEAAWEGASEAIIFNFLSSRCGEKAPKVILPVRRLDPIQLLKWSMVKTTDVAFRQDYFPHGHDATILLKKT